MKILYSTPTNNHHVVESSQGLFGGELIYHIISNNMILHSFENTKQCYEWLLKKMLISKDEYRLLVEK